MTTTVGAAPATERAPTPERKTSSRTSPYPLGEAFAKGDLLTRLSAVVMGLGNLARGQFVKGAVFLAAEALFIYMLIRSGVDSLKGLGELGPVTEGGQLWDESGNLVNVNPTNSVTVLLYGVMWVFVVVAFAVLWSTAVRSAYKAQVLVARTGRAESIVDDAKDLLDGRVQGSLMALPTLGIVVFTVLPLVFMMLMAFTEYDHNHTPAFNWNGLSTFATVFSKTGSVEIGVNVGLFGRVLLWTLIWAFFATFLNFFLGMFITMVILRKGTRLKSLWRILFSMSIAVPQFVSLLAIRQMLNENGIVNQMLKNAGLIDSALPFWTNAWWARVTVIVINLWIGIPFTIMQITGILQNVPAELYEASKIDGANWWQTFTEITMPYIFFVMTPYLITTFTANVNNFNVIYLLSNGGPTRVGESAGQTDLLITWLFKLTSDKDNYNVGAVIGILTFVVLAAVALVTYRSSGSYKNEEGFR
ncbi:MAG: sugar ABC transporter permease [Propionibacteriaceae bacterium]|jgi:arabinogalactan oligomer/maltooligosaccharide transport system permease protein|nr:sugar ABC transporter permease [Propionibacteriaceae bacterium]